MSRRYLHGVVFGTILGIFAAGPANAMGGGGELVIVANQEPQSMQAQVTYNIGQAQLLARFDRTLSSELVTASTLPRSATQQWLVKRPHESAVTHRHRISIVRQFAQFMCRSGYVAAVPPR